MIAYQADWICPATSPPVRNGMILVEGQHIRSVSSEAVPHGVELKAMPGCAILPGFVNPHTHLELTLFKGMLGFPGFTDWIGRLVRMKYQQCSPEALRLSAELGAKEMLQAGVTAVGEVMDVGSGWEAMLAADLQGVAYQEVFGPAESTADEALKRLR